MIRQTPDTTNVVKGNQSLLVNDTSNDEAVSQHQKHNSSLHYINYVHFTIIIFFIHDNTVLYTSPFECASIIVTAIANDDHSNEKASLAHTSVF